MQNTNISTGVYEQIINRLFLLKLNKVDAERFYGSPDIYRGKLFDSIENLYLCAMNSIRIYNRLLLNIL